MTISNEDEIEIRHKFGALARDEFAEEIDKLIADPAIEPEPRRRYRIAKRLHLAAMEAIEECALECGLDDAMALYTGGIVPTFARIALPHDEDREDRFDRVRTICRVWAEQMAAECLRLEHEACT